MTSKQMKHEANFQLSVLSSLIKQNVRDNDIKTYILPNIIASLIGTFFQTGCNLDNMNFFTDFLNEAIEIMSMDGSPCYITDRLITLQQHMCKCMPHVLYNQY